MAPKTSRDAKAGRNQGVSRESRTSKGPKVDAQRSRRQAKRARAERPAPRIRFGRRSLGLFGAGLVSIAVGYVTLASGSITLAPILLVAGYCVFFPMGILLKDGPGAQRGGE